MATGKYVMTISRLTIDKLGVKLYDRMSAVIAELVSNGYDANATQTGTSECRKNSPKTQVRT
jgi:hypothetical protein